MSARDFSRNFLISLRACPCIIEIPFTRLRQLTRRLFTRGTFYLPVLAVSGESHFDEPSWNSRERSRSSENRETRSELRVFVCDLRSELQAATRTQLFLFSISRCRLNLRRASCYGPVYDRGCRLTRKRANRYVRP